MLVAASAAYTSPAAATMMPAVPVINTLAGGSSYGLSGDGGPAKRAELGRPFAVTSDSDGNIYIADTDNHRVRKVTPAGTISTLAGSGPAGPGQGAFGGDGGPATQALLDEPRGVAVGPDHSIYISDSGNRRIRKVDGAGTITTVAGNGVPASAGDGRPATQASLSWPAGLAFDSTGDLYVADVYTVRKIDSGGTITTFAGSAADSAVGGSFSGDGGPATEAHLNLPSDVAIDAAGDVYIADTYNNRIRMVDPSGTITTVVGGGTPEDGLGDGGPATASALGRPYGVSTDQAGNLYIADLDHARVRQVQPSGNITTIAGGGAPDDGVGDGGPPTAAGVSPYGVEVDPAGNVLMTDSNRVRVVGALSVTTIDAADPVLAGRPLSYTLTASNSSSVAATDVILTDALPARAAFVSASPSQGTCRQADGTLRCRLGTLGPQTAATVMVNLAAPTKPGSAANTVRMTATHPDRVLVDNRDTERTAIVPPRLVVAVNDGPDPANVGDTLTYTVSVTNALGAPASGVSVSDALPARLSYRSAIPSQGTCSAADNSLTCALGALAEGATATVEVRATAEGAGVVANTATATATEFPTGASATAKTQVSSPECGMVISATTTLDHDIGPCAGGGIVVGADDVTLDLGGHRVYGFPTPSDGTAAGIALTGRRGVSVRNGTVSGFDAGVAVVEGGSNTLRELTVADNIGPYLNNTAPYGDGIVVVNSAANEIVGNHLIHNGTYDGIGILGTRSNDNLIQANVVEDTVGTDEAAFGQGIAVLNYWNANDSGKTITGTRIVGNLVRRSAGAGLSNISSAKGTIVGNRVEDNGTAGGYQSNGIGVQMGLQADQQAQMLVQYNEVHHNAWDGIQLGYNGAGQSQILDNNAADNNTAGIASAADLHDGSFCATNVWLRNTWGSGGYDPACTTVGGSGPGAVTDPPQTTTPPPGVDPLQPLRGQPLHG